jgi:diguanylate cyclase (GGDEF)-like protein/PAS domain S-box-containing protein
MAALRTAALDALPKASIIAFDPELRVFLAQGNALADEGRDTEDLVGRRLQDLVSPSRYARLCPHYEAALRGERTFFENPSIDGNRWYWVTMAPLVDESGEVHGGLAISQDVTDSKRAEQELETQRQLLGDVLDSLGIPVSVKDADGRFVLINRTYEEWLRCRREDLLGRTNHDLFPEPFASAFTADEQRVLSEGVAIEEERPTPARDGVMRTLSITRAPLRDPSGRVYGLCAAATDLTARRAVEEELRAATQLFETAFSRAAIGMALVGLDGEWLRTNQALSQLLGYTAEELGELTFQQITHPDDLNADLHLVHQLLTGDIDDYTMEKRYITKCGTEKWVLLAASVIRDEAGKPVRFIAQIQDIQHRKEMEAQLQELADADPLTGIWNRRRFEEELERQIARCHRNDERAALLVLDLDGFKKVNDRHGHGVGDALLEHVCRTLRSQLRATDSLGRMGGDEFAVILAHVSSEQAASKAAALVAGLRESPLRIHGLELRASASVGVATLDRTVCTAGEAYEAADKAMYARKRGPQRAVAWAHAL